MNPLLNRRQVLRRATLLLGGACVCHLACGAIPKSTPCTTPLLEPASLTAGEKQLDINLALAPSLDTPGCAARIILPDRALDSSVTEAEKATNRWTWKKPGFPQADDHRVVWLSWNDALRYARWAGVDLPTESEWLQACRAGSTSQFFCGDAVENDFVWHRGNAPDGTRPVATRRPNAWGLHDLLGSAYDDDRGFRCLRRDQGPSVGGRNSAQ
jgi:hypothetical protein